MTAVLVSMGQAVSIDSPELDAFKQAFDVRFGKARRPPRSATSSSSSRAARPSSPAASRTPRRSSPPAPTCGWWSDSASGTTRSTSRRPPPASWPPPPGTNDWAVADHAMGLIIDLAPGSRGDRLIDPAAGAPSRSRRLAEDDRDRRAGRIGKGVARRARGFDMRVLAYEPYPDQAFVQAHGVELIEMDDLLAQSTS